MGAAEIKFSPSKPAKPDATSLSGATWLRAATLEQTLSRQLPRVSHHVDKMNCVHWASKGRCATGFDGAIGRDKFNISAACLESGATIGLKSGVATCQPTSRSTTICSLARHWTRNGNWQIGLAQLKEEDEEEEEKKEKKNKRLS